MLIPEMRQGTWLDLWFAEKWGSIDVENKEIWLMICLWRIS